MKIGLIGFGKMGKKVEEQALLRGHTVPVKVTRSSRPDLNEVDLLIDFSSSDSALNNIKEAAKQKKNIVIGTTGWDHDLKEAKKIAEKEKIGLLYSPNFSIGIHLFLKLARQASLLLKDYDLAGIETHHREKKDAPSGTALALEAACQRECPFTSVRLGTIPGTHSLIFDSPHDTITLTHQAKTRDGFALGAVIAAEWLEGKQGYFTLEEIFS
jgi:4-hydroxy-tetrahydrodipicolinate reductase